MSTRLFVMKIFKEVCRVLISEILYKIKRCRNKMSLKHAKNHKELKLYFEKKTELEHWRRKFYGLDACLNQVIVQNNKTFEENKTLLEEIDKKKLNKKYRRRHEIESNFHFDYSQDESQKSSRKRSESL